MYNGKNVLLKSLYNICTINTETSPSDGDVTQFSSKVKTLRARTVFYCLSLINYYYFLTVSFECNKLAGYRRRKT